MLTLWRDRIFSEISTVLGRAPEPTDSVIANSVLLHLMQSPLWSGGEFEGVEFHIHEDGTGFSELFLPERFDPDSDGELSIRDKTYVSVFQEFFDSNYIFDDLDTSVWVRNSKAPKRIVVQPVYNDVVNEILSNLQSEPYLANLISREKGEVERLTQAKNELRFQLLDTPDLNVWDLNQYSHIDASMAISARYVFGHRYLEFLDNRKLIVAYNFMGPVGVLCLFDHAAPGVLNGDECRYTISFVSVSPGYRRKGIASMLMRQAFQTAIEHKKFVSRTSPTTIGENTFDHFSHLAEKEFPGLPVIRNHESTTYSVVNKRLKLASRPYRERSAILSRVLKAARSGEDSSEAMFCLYPTDDFSRLAEDEVQKIEVEERSSVDLSL